MEPEEQEINLTENGFFLCLSLAKQIFQQPDAYA
jgi:hypothetical protein